MYNYAICLLPFVIYTVALPVDFEAHAPPLPDLAALEPLPDHVSHAPLPSAGTDAPLPDLEADESIPDLKARKPLPDLGVPQWSCDPAVMAKSKEVPKSVHSVRFADIKVFAALGDSLSAGNGANARGPLGLLKEFRGVSFVGGDMTLEEHITIPNVLRKFNPNLFGYSTGTGKWNSWKVSKLNMAIPGSEAKDMPVQAQRLVDVMRQRNEINITNDWKLVNIFVGGNDVCRHCHELHTNRSLTNGPDAYKRNLIKAIQILKDNLPRTIVSLTGMFNIEMLRPVDRLKLFCIGLHFIYECHCEFHMKKTRQLCMDYMTVQQEIMDEGLFDSSDDFALVLQPFAKGIDHPPLTSSGKANLQFFAPDCFHFSKYGHSNFAKHLWNNFVQPVGAKATSVDLSDVNAPLQCPSKDCPLFPTTKNSKNCTAYMTPSVLDG